MKTAFYIIMFFPYLIKGQQVLNNKTVHLRDGVKQEWSSFPVHAGKSQLTVSFRAKDTIGEKVLSITQSDVNHPWKVILNDHMLGTLVIDEKQMVTYFKLTPGFLKENDNTLVIRPETENNDQPDDILAGNIILINSAIDELLKEASLNIHAGIPSRLTILNEEKSLQPINASPGDTLAIRSGLIYSGTGNFSFSLPAGKYKIYASRGFEYGVDSATINIKQGEYLNQSFLIDHEVKLQGWVSCDTHVHTLEYSGHGDATMKERILTIAGEGLDYAVITEHNKVVDIVDSIKKMKMEKWFSPIAGDELTTKVGHFNIFPSFDAPSPDVKNWNEVIQTLSNGSGKKIIVLNHARDLHNGFRPSDTIFKVAPEQFPANAMEVMNSGSQQTEPRRLYLDWMALMSRGIILTPVGSSDSHDVGRFIVGQARTYVRSDDDLISNFLKGRVGVSFGLFTELKVDTHSMGRKKTVTIQVHCPSWIRPGKVMLFANGKKIYSSSISHNEKSVNNIFSRKTTIPKYPQETILVAVAEGPDPLVPWWPVAKPYQHTSPEVNPIVLGITGPLMVSP